MNRSDKITVICASACEALAAYLFFAVVTQFISQSYGASGATVSALKIGQILFGVYGYSAILAPLFLAVSGVLLFIGKATIRAGVYVAASLVPFASIVLTEKVARFFLLNDASSLTPFKVAAVIVVCALVVAIEYVFIGMLADFIATKQEERESEQTGGQDETDNGEHTGKKARRKNDESDDDDDIPETAFSLDTDFDSAFTHDEESSDEGDSSSDLGFNAQSETADAQDGFSQPFALKPRKINGADNAHTAAENGTPENESQNGDEAAASADDVAEDQNDSPKKKHGMSAFTIPEFIPYNEQIAQKDVVWKDYETIGDYVRKPNPKTAGAERAEDDGFYDDESADFGADANANADGDYSDAENSAENAEAKKAAILFPAPEQTAEEPPIFVNFKKMNVPDLAEAIDRAKAESEYAHHARQLEVARRLRESVAHEVSPFSPLAQNDDAQTVQNAFTQSGAYPDEADETKETSLTDDTGDSFDADFDATAPFSRDVLNTQTPLNQGEAENAPDAYDEGVTGGTQGGFDDDIFDEEETGELEDLTSDDEAAFLENPFEDEEIFDSVDEAESINDAERGGNATASAVPLDSRSAESASVTDDDAVDGEHESAIDEAFAEAKAAIGKQPYAPVKPLSFDEPERIEPIFESDSDDKEQSPVTVADVLNENVLSDTNKTAFSGVTNETNGRDEETGIEIPIVFDDEAEAETDTASSWGTAPENDASKAQGALKAQNASIPAEDSSLQTGAQTANVTSDASADAPRLSGLLSAAKGVQSEQNASIEAGAQTARATPDASAQAGAPAKEQSSPFGDKTASALENTAPLTDNAPTFTGKTAAAAEKLAAFADQIAPSTENASFREKFSSGEKPAAAAEKAAANTTADNVAPVNDAASSLEQTSAQSQTRGAPAPVTSRWKKPYVVPSEGLLTSYPDGQYWIIDDETQRAAAVLKQTLSEFKIEADVTGIRKGPVITMFEILPAPGVKLNRIVALQDNIALRLAASSVRIVAPIPGKHAVGIEVPNKERSIVSFKELVDNDSPLFKKMEIPVVLGKDITGEAKLLDLAATPHLLIAGSTGSGKSVCVNTMILSILYKRSPEQVKMILIDPKIVELKLYNDIPHLLTPVITEPKKAFQVLQYCLCEMERRYAMLDHMGVRDIKSYNRRIEERNICNEKLPYIVIIIDEFADLMATTGKELESMVARLAAMSRAVGIHLVLATQRPSIDVITGLIKANIPTRIAFMVASKMDSRIIIDQVGAEKLLGKGDMLYASAVDPFPVRIQGTFVSEEEVEKVVDYVKGFGEPDYIDEEIFFDEDEEESEPTLFSDGEDPLYEKALEIVLQAGKASASYIQRRLKIGYNRAARLVEEMEERGIVGPANGSKPRDVLHVPSRAPQLSAQLQQESALGTESGADSGMGAYSEDDYAEESIETNIADGF